MLKLTVIASIFVTIWARPEPPLNSYLPPDRQNNNGRGIAISNQYGPPGFDGVNSVVRDSGNGVNGSSEKGHNRPSDSYGTPEIVNGDNGNTNGNGGNRKSDGFNGGQLREGGQRNGKPSSQYGSPDVSNFSTRKKNGGTPSNSYGAPQGGIQNPRSREDVGSNGGQTQNSGSLEDTYGPPNIHRFLGRGTQLAAPGGQGELAKRPSSNYGTPRLDNKGYSPQMGQDNNHGSQNDRRNNFATQRGGTGDDRPSNSYSPPNSNRGLDDGGISDSYGPPPSGPQQTPSGEQGYGRDGPDAGQNNEPTKYEFNYEVKDAQAGIDFGQTESRDGDRARGMFNVLLPDGRKQIVEYEADQDGFKPQIRYEGEANAAGYSPNSENDLGYASGSTNNDGGFHTGSTASNDGYSSNNSPTDRGYTSGGPSKNLGYPSSDTKNSQLSGTSNNFSDDITNGGHTATSVFGNNNRDEYSTSAHGNIDGFRNKDGHPRNRDSFREMNGSKNPIGSADSGYNPNVSSNGSDDFSGGERSGKRIGDYSSGSGGDAAANGGYQY